MDIHRYITNNVFLSPLRNLIRSSPTPQLPPPCKDKQPKYKEMAGLVQLDPFYYYNAWHARPPRLTWRCHVIPTFQHLSTGKCIADAFTPPRPHPQFTLPNRHHSSLCIWERGVSLYFSPSFSVTQRLGNTKKKEKKKKENVVLSRHRLIEGIRKHHKWHMSLRDMYNEVK